MKAKLAETPPIGGIGEDGDERLARRGELVQRGGGLRHLHEREEPLLHACAARRGEAHERELLVAAGLDRANEALADDGAHGAPQEPELESRDHHGNGLDPALHHHERVGLARVPLRVMQAIGVLLAVLELERVDRNDLAPELGATFRVEEEVEALARVRRLWNEHFGQTWRLFSRSVK
jgi:hypothetical protein